MVSGATANQTNREMVHARGRQDRPYKDIANPVQWRVIITNLPCSCPCTLVLYFAISYVNAALPVA